MIKRIPSALLLSLLVSTSHSAGVTDSFNHVDDSTIVVKDQKPIHNSFNNVKNVVILVLNQLDQKANNQLVDALTKQMINHFNQINEDVDRFKGSKREPFVNYLATQLSTAYKSSISLNEQLAKAQKDLEKNRLYILKMKKENKSADYKQILKEALEALNDYNSERYQAILKAYEEDKRFNEDLKNHANSHYLRGMDYRRNSNYPDAKIQLKKAVDYDSENGEYLLSYGVTLHHLGDYEEALRQFTQALPIFQASKDRENEGTTLNNISQIYQARGDLTTALTYLQQSLAIYQAIGDKSGEGTTLGNMGSIYRARGDLTTALTYLQQSLAIRQAIEDKSGEGTTLNNISQIYDARGDLTTALTYLNQSLAISQAIGDKSGEGTTLNNISQIYKARGDLTTALTYLQQSLVIRQAIGDKSGEGTTLNNISQIYKARGDLTTALTYLQQSLSIQQAIGDKSGEGTTLNNISQIYHARGDLTTALTYLQQSLAISQAIGDKSGEGTTLNNISQIYKARGDLTTALTYLQQSLAIYQAIGDKSGMCATLFNIGHIYWGNDDHDHAIQNWVGAYRIAKQIENAQALHALEGLAKRLGHEKGLELWETLSQMRP